MFKKKAESGISPGNVEPKKRGRKPKNPTAEPKAKTSLPKNRSYEIIDDEDSEVSDEQIEDDDDEFQPEGDIAEQEQEETESEDEDDDEDEEDFKLEKSQRKILKKVTSQNDNRRYNTRRAGSGKNSANTSKTGWFHFHIFRDQFKHIQQMYVCVGDNL